METFSARYWPYVRGIHQSTVNSPHKGQWRGALMFSLICVWINGWGNNCEAGDLRCSRIHSDVIVMMPSKLWFDTLIYILHQSTQCCMEYHVILDRVIMALDCNIESDRSIVTHWCHIYISLPMCGYKLDIGPNQIMIDKKHATYYFTWHILQAHQRPNLNQYLFNSKSIFNITDVHTIVFHVKKKHMLASNIFFFFMIRIQYSITES